MIHIFVHRVFSDMVFAKPNLRFENQILKSREHYFHVRNNVLNITVFSIQEAEEVPPTPKAEEDRRTSARMQGSSQDKLNEHIRVHDGR